jgi:membrane-associated protein
MLAVLAGIVDQLAPWFHEWGLLIVFLATFLESSILIASVVPGESTLLLAGFFASNNSLLSEGPVLDLEWVITVAFLGALLGDIAGFYIGKRFGPQIVARWGKYVFLSPDRMPVLEAYFREYGRRAVLFGRFAPFLRSVRTLIAGTAGMEFRVFFAPAFVGAAAWATLVAVTGFILSESYRVADLYLGTGGFVVLGLLIVGFFFTWRGVRRKVQQEIASPMAPDGDIETEA